MFVQAAVKPSEPELHLAGTLLHLLLSALRQKAESGGHSQLPRVTGGVRGQVVLIRCDVRPWDPSPMRDNPPNRY